MTTVDKLKALCEKHHVPFNPWFLSELIDLIFEQRKEAIEQTMENVHKVLHGKE